MKIQTEDDEFLSVNDDDKVLDCFKLKLYLT